MAKVLAVFGATGHQGSSVVRSVLSDPDLSSQYRVRAITRDVHSAKVKALGSNIEVMKGDTNDSESIKAALRGVHTVFLVSSPDFTPGHEGKELDSNKAIADAAVSQGVKYLIFSTLPHISKISGGRYTKVHHFDGKALAEEYIRSLPIKSAFISVGGYFQNFEGLPPFTPSKISEDTWAVQLPMAPDKGLPMLDADGDLGKFVNSILAQPAEYEGKVLHVSERYYTNNDIVKVLSKTTGKNVIYKEINLNDFKAALGGGNMADIFAETFSYPTDFDYFGAEVPASEKGQQAARGKLTSLEEYFTNHPLQLA